jgi:lipoprotein NlpD
MGDGCHYRRGRGFASGLGWAAVLAALMLQAGCMLGPAVAPAPAPDSAARKAPPARTASGLRVVRTGDTLYSIAFDAGVDYRALARWNNIAPPHVIYPGQRIRLSRPQPTGAAGVRSKPRAAKKSRTIPPKQSPSSSAGASARGWSWPTNGKVIGRFSNRLGSKGIDIAGRRGQTIRAAAAGRVVYAGSGLRGYGELIIVKHNETFLSAYAHNRKILVKEGTQVSSRQPIAEMGSSGTDRVKLHFEIRRRGQPVDPLQYLPRR